jgi:uncharacterized protein
MGQPDDIRTRLRRALSAALKARNATATSALRSALGAIANAEAAERETAAVEYERSGYASQAARLRDGNQALLSVLNGEADA